MKPPAIVARRIGREQQPIAIIDDFALDPAALRAAAVAANFTPAGEHYPGIRAALPRSYFTDQQAVIGAILREVFEYREHARLLDAGFSIVTALPAALSVEQRLPHFDAVEVGRIALVHYLSPDIADGTAFFRHRSTGFETVDASRAPAYFARLNAELRAGAMPIAGYIADSTPLFERIDRVEARYNRAILYRSALFHSGAIRDPARLTADPATGRLTVTAFLEAS